MYAGYVTIYGNPPSPACVYEATQQLGRAYEALENQELKVQRFLGLYYRRLSSTYAQIKAARDQREAFATQVRLRSEDYRAGAKDATLDLVLEAQRFWADALATEHQAIASYNNAQVGWEYGKGAILAYAHVALAEEPPAGCDKVCAVKHERKRTREQVRREPGMPVNSPLTVPGGASLPALWKSFPPLRDAGALPASHRQSSQEVEPPNARLTEWKVSDIFPPDRRRAKEMP